MSNESVFPPEFLVTSHMKSRWGEDTFLEFFRILWGSWRSCIWKRTYRERGNKRIQMSVKLLSHSIFLPSFSSHFSLHSASPVHCSLTPLLSHSLISSCPWNPSSLPWLLKGGNAQWWTSHERLNRSEFKGNCGVGEYRESFYLSPYLKR